MLKHVQKQNMRFNMIASMPNTQNMRFNHECQLVCSRSPHI